MRSGGSCGPRAEAVSAREIRRGWVWRRTDQRRAVAYACFVQKASITREAAGQLPNPYGRELNAARGGEFSQITGHVLRQQLDALGCSNLRLTRQLAWLRRELAAARFVAGHDQLTGLVNRSLLFDRVDQAFNRANRSHQQVALLLLGLDGFKGVNDRCGHLVGDELLRQVAQRLAGCVRTGDTISRYGGDEFVLMLPDVEPAKTASVAAAVAHKVRASLAAPYAIDGSEIAIGASVGIAIYRSAEQTCSELRRRADTEMYREKRTSPR